MSEGYRRSEQRFATRRATPGKLWWLGERDENFALGWTANASETGLAFVTSAGDRVRVGETISISRTDPRKSFADCETLRICRLEPYGPSLQLIACSRLP